MTEIREDVINNYYEEETYSKGLNREDTIENQVRTTIFFYSRKKWDAFEYSLKVLIALLPRDVRKKFTPIDFNTSSEGIEKHYQQFVKLQDMLETDTNLIFKKKFIKTYE